MQCCQALENSLPEIVCSFAYAGLYPSNQLFEFRKERIYLAAQSARKVGADVYYVVNGDKISPGLDRALYSANLRIIS